MILVKHETAEGRKCSVEVSEGTLAAKLQRGKHIQQIVRAQRAAGEDTPTDVFSSLVELHTYPSCVACSQNLTDTEDEFVRVDDLSFEQFTKMPDQFVEKWATAAFELNPGWQEDTVFPLMRPSSLPVNSK